MISIGKKDARSISPISIFIDGEIVTTIQCSYSGTVSGFDAEPILW